jgi:hypothetical protein
MPDDSQVERRPDDAGGEAEAMATEGESAKLTTIEKVIEAYRQANRDSVEVARQALAIPDLNEVAMRASEAFCPPNLFVEMLENQARVSKMLSALSTPVPLGLTTFMANLNHVHGLAKMIEDALLPSRQLSNLFDQFSTPLLSMTDPDSSPLQSLRDLTLANSLDTSVALILAGISNQPSAIDVILKSWRSSIWDDIQESSLMLEQLQASTVASGILETGSLERFFSVRLFQATSLRESPENAEETARVEEFVRTEFLDTVEVALRSVDPRLVKMWRGAKQALKSGNPDRSRHLAVSLREMTTHLLHNLAPDDAVKSWSTSEDDFHQGRPTRKARIWCIYARYGPEVQAFFAKDVDSAVYWIDIINKQTHTLEGLETDEAMEALLARFEGIVLALIRGAKGFD